MWMVKTADVLGTGAGVLWQVVLFIGLSSKCLLSTCYVPDTFLGPGATGETCFLHDESDVHFQRLSPPLASVWSIDYRG